MTGVIETAETFSGNWTGTGAIAGAGDAETVCLDAGEYMESPVVDTGTVVVELGQNVYDGSGDDVSMYYRHGATEIACLAAAYNLYAGVFDSLGYVQIRLENP